MEKSRKEPSHTEPHIDTGLAFTASVILVFLFAGLNLAGIVFNVQGFRSLIPGTEPMKWMTSVCLVLMASSLILIRSYSGRAWRLLLSRVLMLPVFMICMPALYFHLRINIIGDAAGMPESWLFAWIFSSDSILTFVTAILFLMSGITILILPYNSSVSARLIHFLIFPVLAVSYLVLTSYILEVHSIHAFRFIRMAAGTCLAFISLSISALCFNSDTWFMRVFLSRGPGSIALRRLLPGLLFLPLFIGWTRIWVERLGWISSEVGVVAVAMAYTICFIFLAWLVAKSVNRLDMIRKAVEESERKSQQRLKYHFENSPLGIVEWDSDLVVTRWSDEAEHLFGWNRMETIGLPIDALNLIFPDDIPIVEKTIGRLLKGNERHVVSTNRNLTKSGNIRTCTWYNSVLTNEKGEMTSVMSQVLDITDRVRAEDELRHLNEELEMIVRARTSELSKTMSDLAIERERFKVVLDRLPVFVMLIDADYRIVFSNKRFADTFGEAHRKRCHELLFGRTDRCETCGASEVFSLSTPCNWEWTGPDQRIYHVSDFPFTDIDGSRLVLEVGLDITEEKNIEKLILGKVIEAEENNRKRLSGDLHDDLGPILSTIKLQLGMIYRSESEMKVKEITGSCEDLLSEAIEKIRMLANNLMPGVLEKFGLEAAVGSFIKKIGGENQFQIEFKSELGDARFDMDCELHLYRVITELITNTMRHSAADFARLSIRHQEEKLEIKYSDNGKGYMPVKIPSLNMGMGLQNISNRVNLLNGKIEFSDIRGKTHVRISIPQKISK